MGRFLNPGSGEFRKDTDAVFYADKSALITFLNDNVLLSEDRYIYVSRPKGFGKTVTIDMLAAYYGRGDDSSDIFSDLEASQGDNFLQNLNSHNVIKVDVKSIWDGTHDVRLFFSELRDGLLGDLSEAYPGVTPVNGGSIISFLVQVYADCGDRFIFLADNWDEPLLDVLTAEEDKRAYADMWNAILKGREYVEMAFITGLLPVSHHCSEPTLDILDEYTMTDSYPIDEFLAFTHEDVTDFCAVRPKPTADETEKWYRGYTSSGLYSPARVLKGLYRRTADGFEPDGEIKDTLIKCLADFTDGEMKIIVSMLAGNSYPADTDAFYKDAENADSLDAKLLLMVHLGLLSYDESDGSVSVPDYEMHLQLISVVREMCGVSAKDAHTMSVYLGNDTACLMRHSAEYEMGRIRQMYAPVLDCDSAGDVLLSLAYSSLLDRYSMFTLGKEDGNDPSRAVLIPDGPEDGPAYVIGLSDRESAENVMAGLVSSDMEEVLGETEGAFDEVVLAAFSYDARSGKFRARMALRQ